MNSAKVAAVVAAAGLVSLGPVSAARAASTTLRYEVSVNHAPWGSSANAQPGDLIEVRARVVWTGADPAFGLSQFAFQPVVSSWTDSDALITDPTSPGGMGIEPGPAQNRNDPPPVWNYGRVQPFRTITSTTSTFLRGFVGEGTASGLLRIAQANITNWIGVGPTSGPDRNNNWSGNGGVNVAQIAPPTRVPTDPDPNFTSDPIVFVFGYHVGNGGPSYFRDMVIDTPLAGIGRETSTTTGHYGDNYAGWFLSTTSPQGTRFYNDIGTEAAVVHVTPSPGGVALVAGGLVVARRRRRV